MTKRDYNESRKPYCRDYYQKNKDKWRTRYEDNFEYLMAYQREYYTQHVDEVKTYQRKRKRAITNPTVYVMTNTITGKRYVGSALLYRDRQSEHHWALKNGVHYCDAIQEDYTVHGWSSFSFTILERNIVEEFLRARELYWYQRLKPEYNSNIPRKEDLAGEPLPIRKRRYA